MFHKFWFMWHINEEVINKTIFHNGSSDTELLSHDIEFYDFDP